MLDHYRDNIAMLHPAEIDLVASKLQDHHLLPTGPRPATPDDLYQTCLDHNLAHADLVLPLVPVPGLVARNCIEKLLGRPVTRTDPEIVETYAAHAEARVREVRNVDRRTIHDIVPNPKRPGSAAHERFSMYREGMTVQEYYALGGIKQDINWDSRPDKQFITLRHPDDSDTP